MPKYFFDSDDSGHWYMIPAEKKKRWKEVNKMPDEIGGTENFDKYDAFQEFNDYRTSGGIEGIVFEISEKDAKKVLR